MASPAMSMATYLVGKGIATLMPTAAVLPAWNLSISRLLAKPHRLICVTDTGGFTPNTKWQLDFPTVQALVRGNPDDYAATYQKALDIKDALLGADPQAVGSGAAQVWWSGVTMLSDITLLHYDESSRPLLSMNFRMLMERTKSALSNRDPLNYTGP